MKKTLKYGIYAEDEANKSFLLCVIPQILVFLQKENEFDLLHQTDFTSIAAAKNGDFISETFINRIEQGIRYYDLNLCFVARDTDDTNYDIHFEKMNEQLETTGFQQNCVLVLPVQAIEYWLWYLKAKKEKWAITAKETENRKDLKKQVYGRVRCNNAEQTAIITQLTENIDIPFLCENSASFQHFHDKFKALLA